MNTASQTQLTLLRKLKQRKYRYKEQRFIVEGERAVEQVIANGQIQVEAVFIKGSKLDHFEGVDDRLFLMDAAEFAELSDTESPQGILALCVMPEPADPDTFFNTSGLIIATDALQDPGNLGTIIRTAVWYGCKGLLLGTGTVDPFNQKVVRSTAGATGILPKLQGNLSLILSQAEAVGWNILLLDGNAGATSIHQEKLKEKTILVVGNEGNGLNEELFSTNRKRIMVPGNGAQDFVESLNAAIAVSISMALLSK